MRKLPRTLLSACAPNAIFSRAHEPARDSRVLPRYLFSPAQHAAGSARGSKSADLLINCSRSKQSLAASLVSPHLYRCKFEENFVPEITCPGFACPSTAPRARLALHRKQLDVELIIKQATAQSRGRPAGLFGTAFPELLLCRAQGWIVLRVQMSSLSTLQ